MESVFNSLNGINVNGHTEKKNGLTYLSWAWAWAEVKKLFPDAQYKIYERDTEYGPVNYFTDGRTCWVKTGVIINGLEHVEMLPVMDYKNRSIPYDAVNSMDVNKAVQRSLTKACARHGLGLYIYAGEDLPEGAQDAPQDEPLPQVAKRNPIKEYCDEVGMPLGEFGRIRSELVAQHIVPAIASNDMTEEQMTQLIEAVEARRVA